MTKHDGLTQYIDWVHELGILDEPANCDSGLYLDTQPDMQITNRKYDPGSQNGGMARSFGK